MRRVLVIGMAVSVVVVWGGGGRACAAEGVREAVGRGLEFLARSQRADGSWGSEEATARAVIAFLSAGEPPAERGGGRYGLVVARGRDALMRSAAAEELGRENLPEGAGREESAERARALAEVVTALAELLGVEHEPRKRAEVRAALDLVWARLLRAQRADGSWGGDLTATAAAGRALRAARSVGADGRGEAAAGSVAAEVRGEAAAGAVGAEGRGEAAAGAVGAEDRGEAAAGSVRAEVRREAAAGAVGVEVRREAAAGAVGVEVRREAAAGAVGADVRGEAAGRAIGFVLRCRTGSGGFADRPGGEATAQATAAGAWALRLLAGASATGTDGVLPAVDNARDLPEADAAVAWLVERGPAEWDGTDSEAVLRASRHAGGAAWTRVWGRYGESLGRRQRDDGSFGDTDPERSTADAVIALTVPWDVMPSVRR